MFEVPRASGKFGVAGGMGQSNVWYAQNFRDENFFKKISELINPVKTRTPTKPDVERNKLVENTAIDIVAKHYSGYGYLVKSVEKDNCGWDLIATIEKLTLNIEVKGLSGKSIYIGLTPNEYKAFALNDVQYRLCIVTECLSNPKLEVFSYNLSSKNWLSQTGKYLSVELIQAASIYAV